MEGWRGEIRLTRVGSAGIKKLKCCFTSIETVGLLGMGAQDGHFDFESHSS